VPLTARQGDVDCLLLIEPGFPSDFLAEAELRHGLPFIHHGLLEQADLDMMV
jgi:hypothetical protein